MTAHLVVWDALGLSQTLTGIERLAVTYCKAMSARDANVAQVFLANEDAEWLDEIPDEVQLNLVRRRPLNLIFSTSGKRAKIPKNGHYHSWGHRVARHQYARSSYTIHDWGPFFDPTMSRKSRYLWRTAISMSIRNVDFIHVTNASVLHGGPSAGLSTRKVVVSGLPVFDNLQENCKQQGTGEYVLFVGTADARKRLNELVAAAAHPDWPLPLVLAGDGTGQYKGRVNIRALGRVSDQELNDLYKNAAAVALISTYEGFGLPVQEALNRGIPVMASEQVASIFPTHQDRIAASFSMDPESLATAATTASGLGRAKQTGKRDASLPLIDAMLEQI